MLDLTIICDIYAAMEVAESRYFHDNFIEKLDKFLDKISLRSDREYLIKVLKFDDKLRSKVLGLLTGFLSHKDIGNSASNEEQKKDIRRLIFSIED